uniref:hypothetical protein n=1 Tax=Methylobacterium sp. B34 TaxID=95563 RepID=UPI000FE146D8|nr:hypothetical protein [Methylobacterium sp. B34]
MADKGIVTDYDAFNLSLDALTMGINVRCEIGSVSRGVIARVGGSIPADPRYSFSFEDASAATRAHVVMRDGRVVLWEPTEVTDLSVDGYVPEESSALVTSCVSNGVLYVNREDRELWYKAKDAGGSYKLLSTYNSGDHAVQFRPNLRFKSLRATDGFLIGINVTDDGVNIPTKVKWSTTATSYGVPPDDWDIVGVIYDDTPNSSGGYDEIGFSLGGENILAEMTGMLVDGLALQNNMILYGTKECWLMEFVGGNAIFNFRRLFGSGILNINCAVEYQGQHYVFGEDGDIYTHDGTGQRQSIAVNRVKEFIGRNLVADENGQAFAFHNRLLNEIMFCFVSNDQYCAFPYTSSGPKGCNRAAVYNYLADTWYFYDLPYCTSATIGPVASGLTYDKAVGLTWQNIGGSWASQGVVATTLLMPSPAFTRSGVAAAAAMRSFGVPDASGTTGAIDVLANAPVLIEKTKLDLDELKGSSPYLSLQGTKLISGVNIEAYLPEDADPIYVSVGSTMHPSQPMQWANTQTFDLDNIRVDCNIVGKYLGLRFTHDDTSSFALSGYDLDVTVLAGR